MVQLLLHTDDTLQVALVVNVLLPVHADVVVEAEVLMVISQVYFEAMHDPEELPPPDEEHTTNVPVQFDLLEPELMESHGQFKVLALIVPLLPLRVQLVELHLLLHVVAGKHDAVFLLVPV